jgi:hypothetical protein
LLPKNPPNSQQSLGQAGQAAENQKDQGLQERLSNPSGIAILDPREGRS